MSKIVSFLEIFVSNEKYGNKDKVYAEQKKKGNCFVPFFSAQRQYAQIFYKQYFLIKKKNIFIL